MCEPVKKLKRCKYFRDVTWTYVTYPDRQNSTQQLMHCRCPKNSVAYLIKRHAFQTPKGTGYQYSFACSPQTVSVNSIVKLFNLQSTKYYNRLFPGLRVTIFPFLFSENTVPKERTVSTFQCSKESRSP